MENRTEKIVFYFIVPLFIAIVSIFGTWYLTRPDDSLQYLDYTVTSYNNVMAGIETDIKINALEAKVFSIVQVNVFNRSSKDFQDAQFLFRLIADSPIVFGIDVKDQFNTKLNNISAGTMTDFMFNVVNVNRDEEKPIVVAQFIVDGSTAPDCIVILDHPGVKMRRQAYKSETKGGVNWLGIVLPILVFMIALLAFFARSSRNWQTKEEKEILDIIPKDRTEYLKFLKLWYDAQQKKEMSQK